ncbi:MAG: hypothetical protein HQL22_08325 [Candidatus Omnitrophica bacterium]|nr:hypothetical protein [Candidatus Omnitrophota bacterium]
MPGTRLALSPSFTPALLKGVRVYADNPFRLDFITDKGNSSGSTEQLTLESTRLIKYFLAAITVPEKDLWVNLSPYEKDRIVPDAFGVTEMGRDLLAQDYMLKQITASVIYPEGEVGKAFWAKVYAEVQRRYGTSDVPVDTFNKVWVVPEKAVVYEGKDSAYVVESKLKVMLEEDYFALEKNTAIKTISPATNKLGSDIVREVVIPILEKEVNEGKNFAQLRQVYHSLILAVWYKDKVKESIFGKAYVDQRKTGGVDIEDKAEKEKIWAQYFAAFKKGAYNYIKEDFDPATQQMVPRKYFSGGVGFQFTPESYARKSPNPAQLSELATHSNPVDMAVLQVKLDAAKISLAQGPSTQLSVEKAFENPQHFRDLMLAGVKIRPLAQYIGKAHVAVDISRFCPVGCTNCYYGSKRPKGTQTTRDALTDNAIDKIIAFSGVANLRTINITGGGDPYVNPKSVYKLVENAAAEGIDLYTSGFWARNKAVADRMMNDLYQAFRARKEKTRLVFRLSMDEFHQRNLGLNPIINLINTFQEKYKDVEGFELQVRTLMNDPTVDELIGALPVERVMVLDADRLGDIPMEKQSLEGEERDSVTRYPEKRIITLKNGYSFTVLSRNRLENVETMPNLHDENVVRRVTRVYDAEMEGIFHNNTATVLNNVSGEPGFDFGINWRGDVTLWGVRLTDNTSNIYEHDFQEIREKILGDVLYLSFMEKGIKYRNDIVSEVDPKSVLRQKAFGVRGQVSDENEEMRDAMIYRDARTRLYLSIRALQDYIAEGRINSDEISGWPEEIRHLVSLDRETLKKLYVQSSYSIVQQYIEDPDVGVKELKSLYQLVSLGNYDVTPEAMQRTVGAIRWLDDEQKRFIFGDDYIAAVNDDLEEQMRQINVALTKVIPMLRKQKAYINIDENIRSENEWRDYLLSMLLDYDADTALDFLSALIIYLNNQIPDAALLKRFDFPLLVRLRKLTVRCHLWTSQAIVEFSKVLKGVLEKVQLKNKGKQPIVIEMGGGYNDLSFGLKELMRSGQVPSVKVVSTDGFYLAKIGPERSKAEYYDMDTVRMRDIRELSAEDILDGCFRKKLGLDIDTPVVIVASHLPYDNNFESTLFQQSNVDDLVLITPITAESLVKESGEKGIVPSEKAWDINPSGFLDHRNWYSGLYTLEGRVQLALQVLSRKSRLENEVGFVNGSANNRYFRTDADGRPIISGEESAGKLEKENMSTLRQLLFKTSEPVYEYPQRVLLTPLMLENIRNAAVVSGKDILDFLNSYLRAGFVSVDVVNNIFAKIEDGSGEAKLSLAEKREILEIIDRVLGFVQDRAVADRVREVQLYVERRFKMAFIHRSEIDFTMVKADNMAAMATRTKAAEGTADRVGDTVQKGGIDLTRDKIGLQVRNQGQSVQFNFDPAMIRQLQSASGLTPIIIDIQPMTTTVPIFLGIENNNPP